MRQKDTNTGIVRCALEVEIAKADDGADGWVVATSPRPDRVDDIVDVDGLDVSQFQRNPIMLWQHDHDEPIGTWEIKRGTTAAGAPAWMVKPTFATGDAVPCARKAEALWGQKVIRAVSIGFRPLEMTPRRNLASDHPAYKEGSWGYYYKSSVLLEVSLVSIPAQPDAVRSGQSAPLATVTLDVAEAVVDAIAGSATLKRRVMELLGAKTEDAAAETLEEWLAAGMPQGD